MEQSTLEQLSHWFQLNKQSHFTGRLSLELEDGQSWSLFFRLGRLVWATGGSHRFRRWQRVLQHFCPALPHRGLQLEGKEVSLLWEYLVLMLMVKRQWVRREQAIALIEHTLTEVLFDIIQESRHFTLSAQTHFSLDNLGEALAVLSAEQTLAKAVTLWNSWTEADLTSYSPNLAPAIKQPQELKQRVSSTTYQRLEMMLDGQSSLRELAIAMKQDLMLLTRSLVAYAHKEWIALQPLPDLVQPKPRPSSSPLTATRRSLIACIDDSRQVCDAMARILTESGYQCVGIQDSLQALPTLLERKPDVIFLDLVMPVASGYEICAQLRRVSIFKTTPIIILTGNDGIVDRVRAKLVGASGFLAKPIETDKVVEMVRRHLATPAPTTSEITRFSLARSQETSIIMPSGL